MAVCSSNGTRAKRTRIRNLLKEALLQTKSARVVFRDLDLVGPGAYTVVAAPSRAAQPAAGQKSRDPSCIDLVFRGHSAPIALAEELAHK